MRKIIKIFTLTCALIASFTVFVFAENVSVTIDKSNGDIPGIVSAELGEDFSGGSIVTIKGEEVDTKGVVDNGKVEFYTPKSGDFQITSTGETIKDCFAENLQSETMYEYAYKGKGTVEDPYVVLSKFADTPMSKFKLQAAWKGYNVLAGYPGMEYYNDSDYIDAYDKSKVYVLRCEDRDLDTGRLKGAFVVNGNLWTFVNGKYKGPYYMNYLIDPTDEFITSGYALDNHYLYNNDNVENVEQRKADAVKVIKSVRDSKTSALFFNYRMRDYSGPITFTVYVGDNGKFKAGDKISISYLLGAGDRNLYHQEKPLPESLVKLEPTYTKYYQDKGVYSIVDEEGYLTFDLYNGGYFELRNETSIKENRDVKITEKIYNIVNLTDVKEDNWAYSSIYEQLKKNYMSAEGGIFSPNETINRADFIKTLILSSGTVVQSNKDLNFEDVPKGSPYRDYVYTAYSNGITSGISDTVFGAEKGLTREMAVVLISRALDINPKENDNFTDTADFSKWSKGYAEACMEKGYLTGYSDGSFGPKKMLTRAETAVLMEKVYKNTVKETLNE
ncbi:S-layer homology domain-containing protein [Anaerovorax odorimutans]|uniref:S-layer homology domain-containing protein n=1 Tax=Anaerovorax odorimutans TaxID=109327 RepID=UPI0003F77795|nr:S-layer homology domain-containing protein [Anaerovorax odorimutans]